MAPHESKHKKSPKGAPHLKTLKRKRVEEDFDALEQRVSDIKTAQGEFKTFADVPLSRLTAKGLEASHFKNLTDIQARGIPFALQGSDILGAAKTGSGKTLAFLVPVLENLYRRKWTELDGLGALILSPTRELAIQIFEVLRKIGRYHTFSAGLVIGGKSLQEERERLGRMNILVCTPGRMLQHMDQTSAFEIGNLQMLVLDEADRILDMGFQNTVDAIVEHLPKERQTMLFSATQTRKVSDLARLSLRNPESVSVHETASSATPNKLQQNYIVTPLAEKVDTLWSFLRSNLKSKILVFMSSGKQVRYVYESFRRMQPGIPLLHIHGRQKQNSRMDVTKRFSDTRNSCLFATDVAARGLDIPAVDWVVQLDCPEDADTYIHRVGRTARYERDGRAVMFLDPTEEEAMMKILEQKKVIVEKIHVRQKKQQSIKDQLQNMCFKDPELKYLSQKAFVSYVRSVHVQKDKDIFKLNKLPLQDFAASMGLPGAPKIKFMKGDSAKQLKNAPRGQADSSDEEDLYGNERTEAKKKEVRTKYDRMFERRNHDVLADHYAKLVDHTGQQISHITDDADEDNDFLTVRRRLSDASSIDGDPGHSLKGANAAEPRKVIIGNEAIVIDSKRKEKMLQSKKKLLKFKGKGTKLVFDEDGDAHEIYELEDEDKFKSRGPADEQRQEFLEAEQERLQAVDLDDKALAKAKRKEKKEKKKTREEREEEPKEGKDEPMLVSADEETGVDLDQIDWSEADDGPKESAVKRPKKWFEDDSDGEPNGRRHKKTKSSILREPQNLESLESIAAGLLG